MPELALIFKPKRSSEGKYRAIPCRPATQVKRLAQQLDNNRSSRVRAHQQRYSAFELSKNEKKWCTNQNEGAYTSFNNFTEFLYIIFAISPRTEGQTVLTMECLFLCFFVNNTAQKVIYFHESNLEIMGQRGACQIYAGFWLGLELAFYVCTLASTIYWLRYYLPLLKVRQNPMFVAMGWKSVL